MSIFFHEQIMKTLSKSHKRFVQLALGFSPGLDLLELGLHCTDPYQGTTSVVPTIPAGIKGFSPCCPFCPKSSRRGLGRRLSNIGLICNTYRGLVRLLLRACSVLSVAERTNIPANVQV
jgi:hypothetical protein